MRTAVHTSAIVSPGARLGADVEIGPYAVIGPDVEIGDGTTVGAHATIEGPTVMGAANRVFPHAVIGFDPQDLKYRGEKSSLKIGNRNVFREFSTVHRGTAGGHGETVVGDNNYFMANSHVAHDCVIGSFNVMANCASLAGHVDIGDHAILGAFAGAHQFIRIGDSAFIGAYSALRQDVLPFCRTEGSDAKTYGLNVVGLKRLGFSEERLKALERAYRLLVKSRLNTTQALAKIEEELSGQPDVDYLVRFIRESKRGFHR
ncbi:MAG TPA: acyl-ACP--UDP-N-acetylglucosamine O-acyltransferase [Thermoanaerobaculia bacterium]|nr:acyl-ACP--UDP-N-acetylglucosamine O-acyltransferase [Thermoanaerobaculia bacterium]